MEYINEMGDSFFIINDQTDSENLYMLQMIIDNQISGIIRCKKGIYNNNQVLKYNVTNKQSLISRYEGKSISVEEIRGLLWRISDIIKKSHVYLLEEQFFYLNPEFIFFDGENNSVELSYIPFGIDDLEKDRYGKYYLLADFFLENVNHKEIKSSDIAFKFYKNAKEPFFSLEKFCMSIEDESKKSLPLFVTDETICDDEKEEVNYGEDQDSSNGIVLPILLIVTGFVVIGLYYYFFKYIISLGLIGIVFILIGLTVLIVRVVRIIAAKHEDNYPTVDHKVSVEEYFGAEEETTFWDDEETVFYNAYENDHLELEINNIDYRERRVFSTFPIQIGKKYEEVDLCIPDSTISRIHAKIEKKNTEFYLTDLDSKNGTYVNDVKIKPNSATKIEKNDEIRFGKVVVSVV